MMKVSVHTPRLDIYVGALFLEDYEYHLDSLPIPPRRFRADFNAFVDEWTSRNKGAEFFSLPRSLL